MGGGVIVYVLFNIFGNSNIQLFILLAAPIVILTLALVFVKINERPFISFIAYFSEYLKQGKEKKWSKSPKIKVADNVVQISDEEKEAQKELEIMSKKGIVKSKLNDLALILDTSGWSGEMIDENLKGRISSDEGAASTIKKNIKDNDVEDVFADLEEAFDKLQSKG